MMKKQSRTILECAIFRHESLEVSKRKSRVWPTFGLTSSEVLKHTVLLVSQNDSHFIISLKDIIIESIYGWRWWGRRLLRCKKMQFCSFDPCSSSSSSMQVSSTATAAAASDNLGKLQISTHDRRIAFFFNPPLLFSAPLLLYAMHFYRNLAYMPKSQRISDNQCTLSTLPLFSRKFKNTNEVILPWNKKP